LKLSAHGSDEKRGLKNIKHGKWQIDFENNEHND